LTLASTAALSACATDTARGPVGSPAIAHDDGPDAFPPLVQRLLDDRPPPSPDTVEVWICDVPPDTTAPLYGGLRLRLELSPDGVIESAGPGLRDYVRIVSGGRHDLRFVAGGTIAMEAEDDEDDCVDDASRRSAPTSDVVLAVATAEHASGFPGGRGRPGSAAGCETGVDCSARATGRAVVVGASDFHPSHGATPLLDLIEHELGHSFGWPHSGTALAGDDRYTSAIDLMSNSAAPRSTRPDRRDGPWPLAINLLDAGWLADDELQIIGNSEGGAELRLVPLDTTGGVRLAVLPVDEHRVLTLEFRRPAGFDDHLPHAGVAVHVVDDRQGTGVMRVHLPVHTDEPPFTDLMVRGDAVVQDGWRIEVLDIGPTAHLAIAATDR
jgi:hypothetical protein